MFRLSYHLSNCFSLFTHDFLFHVSYIYSTIQYLGFGLSGSNVVTTMSGADATIAWVDRNGVAQAKDYFLSGYVQVSLCVCVCVCMFFLGIGLMLA